MSGFLTRPFHCPHYHRKAKRYVVWGGTRQSLIIYSMELYPIGHITPHLVSYGEFKDGNMPIAVTCGVLGCGIELKDPDDLSQGIIFKRVDNYVLPHKEWNALVLFRNTGYELSKFKRK